MLDLDRETFDGIEFVGTILPDRMRKSCLVNPHLGLQNDEMTDNSVDKVQFSPMIDMDQFTQEQGFDVEVSDTAPEPNNLKESLNDLKLEKGNDFIGVNNLLISEDNMVSSLIETTFPVKRARATNLCSQIPLCQVRGCSKDVNSSKDYYKRHRVCEVHSKAARVTINGIVQRFCQQCSSNPGFIYLQNSTTLSVVVTSI